MKYIILNDYIPQNSFIEANYNLTRYSDIFVGTKKYSEQVFSKLKSLSEYTILYTKENLDSYYKIRIYFEENSINIKEPDTDSHVIFWDMKYTHKNLEKFDTLLGQMKYSDNLVLLMMSAFGYESESECCGIFGFPFDLLIQNADNTRMFSHFEKGIKVDCGSDIVNLDDPQSFFQFTTQSFQIRHFNRIVSNGRYYVKSSSKKDKMRAEHNYLKNIPSSIRPYYPQVGEYFEDQNSASYEIEKIFYSDVSKLSMTNLFSDRKILRAFASLLKDYFVDLPVKRVTDVEFRQSLKSLFIDKTVSRVKETENLPIIGELDKLCVFNGFESLNGYSKQLVCELEKAISSIRNESLVFSHGDLCFSNILYSKTLNLMKLIDPRGYCGSDDETYMPAYYDFAKLSHSFLGLYDHMVYDRVSIVVNNRNKLALSFDVSDDYIGIVREEFQRFITGVGSSLRLVRLFESSLFLSMIPLHADSTRRMSIQLIQSMNIFEEYISG